MEKIIVPDDIKKYVLKKYTKKIVLWLSVTAAIVLLLVFFGERTFGKLNDIQQYLIYAVLTVLPFFIFKVYKLFDRSWCGKIEKIDFKYTTDSTRSFKPTLETLYRKESVTFYITSDQGFKKINVFAGAVGTNRLADRYHEGDNIVHIKGTEHYQVINSTDDEAVCVVCGSLNRKEHKECKYCNHTLLIETKDN